jgi:hypothetical protein
MKALLIALCLAALIVTPVAARKVHHASLTSDSISVPAVVAFGSSVTPNAVYSESLGPTETLFVRVTCLANGSVGLTGIASIGQPISIAETPSWSGPDAECIAELVVWDSVSDIPDRAAASASFSVR